MPEGEDSSDKTHLTDSSDSSPNLPQNDFGREGDVFDAPYDVDDPILSLIGGTSLIKYPEELPGDLHVKLEKENPTGSMKDRIAIGMVLEMQLSGELSEEDLVVEASSGNTAGAVALVTNRLGYENIITTPETTSSQKIGYVKALGSDIVKCPDVSPKNEDNYIKKAKKIAYKRNGVFLNQYHNQMNPQIHAKWTGPELWSQTDNLSHVVCPMGTGGTLSGVGKYIKERDSSIKIVGVDAEHSNISNAFYNTEYTEYNTEIEGLGKGSETPTMWFDYVDDVMSIDDASAVEWTKRAARKHGLLVGTSSGAALKVARDIAQGDEDASVALIACDGSEQYFDYLYRNSQ